MCLKGLFLCSKDPVPEYLCLGPLKAHGGFSVYRSTWLILQPYVHPYPSIFSPHCSRATAENHKLSHEASSFFFSFQAILKDFSIIYTKRWGRLISTKKEKLTKCNLRKTSISQKLFQLVLLPRILWILSSCVLTMLYPGQSLQHLEA